MYILQDFVYPQGHILRRGATGHRQLYGHISFNLELMSNLLISLDRSSPIYLTLLDISSPIRLCF